jgi:hypothetical protein
MVQASMQMWVSPTRTQTRNVGNMSIVRDLNSSHLQTLVKIGPTSLVNPNAQLMTVIFPAIPIRAEFLNCGMAYRP